MPEDNSKVDLLIIGAGPAGLMAATWAARIGIKTRIIDKRASKILNGHADGLQSRTLEIFDSFGFGDRAWYEGNHMMEIAFWNPDENGVIRRTDKLPDSIPGMSRYHEETLTQGRIERFFIDHMKKYSDIRVERGVVPEELSVDTVALEDSNAYPFTVEIKHLPEDEAKHEVNHSNMPNHLFQQSPDKDDLDTRQANNHKQGAYTERVQVKYIIGADGAHSWTRRKLELPMEGEQTDFIWGVLDIIPISDFPDIRCRTAIHSAEHGSMMIIPREDRMVRFYIQLHEIKTEDGKADRSKITPELILKAAQKIIAPYKLTYHYIDWYTGYQIGQRVARKFVAHSSRIFLVGDAVHTHSPKAGQGMNVSMQDSYSLAWKIGLVAKGLALPAILETHEPERRSVAQQLIEFDHKFSRLFSGRPAKDAADEAGISMDEFRDTFVKAALFTAGLSVEYGPSCLVARDSSSSSVTNTVGGDEQLSAQAVTANQQLASKAKLGMRIPSPQVLNQASAQAFLLHDLLPSTGVFRIMLFAGNIKSSAQLKRIETLCNKLSEPSSFLHAYTRPSAAAPTTIPDSNIITLLTIHSAPRKQVELLDLPALLHPFDEKLGWDYDTVFVDDEGYHEGHGHAYETLGIDKTVGAAVIVRPDQHVAWVGEVDDIDGMAAYFAGCLVPAVRE